ncbi:hypothetical protein VE02_05826 [Pseudogymnoascus sp. 03VT05]|nr:hypothetical protein VE02_05826 [Pseudogymnoascus sp. 03VT05]
MSKQEAEAQDLDRRWESFDGDQFHRISEMNVIADKLKLCPISTLGKDIMFAIMKEIEEGPNTKVDKPYKEALDTHPVLAHLLVYARGLRLGPTSTMVEDIQAAVAKVVKAHCPHLTTKDSDEATKEAAGSVTKKKRKMIKEVRKNRQKVKF